MRVAVVTGHYIPDMGYVEVELSRALKAEGHELRVFTSVCLPPRAQDKGVASFHLGLSYDGELEVVRLSHRFSLNQVVVAKGLRRALLSYDPDLVIAIGIGKLFPTPILLPSSQRSFRLVALLGNNRFNYRSRSLLALQKRAVQRWIKDPHYRKAVEHCDLLWTYTPETVTILKEFVPEECHVLIEEKRRDTSLGFDPDRFYFDPEARKEGRKEWGFDEGTFLFVTATRPVPSKGLEGVIDRFEELFDRNENCHYLLVGSTDWSYPERLRKRMGVSRHRDRFHMLPFQKEDALRKIFAMADVGLWTVASITVQKAMGTGLPVLLPESPALSHLLQDPSKGLHYRWGGWLVAFEEALHRFGGEDEIRREERARENKERFSNRAIARDIIQRSMQR